MNKILITILFCFSLLTSANFIASCQNTGETEYHKINEELYYKPLNDSVYMITHYFPWAGNSLVVLVDSQHAVLIDTPYDGVATQALLEWIKNTFGDVKVSAIVTGFHQDNLGGNEVLIQNGFPVYGMKLTTKLVETQSEGLMEVMLKSVEKLENQVYFERYKKLKLTPPDEEFELEAGNSKSLVIDGEIFNFYFPGESHTVDNTVVYLPKHKLLFGGCMIRALTDTKPGFIGYANMKEWPASVRKVIDKYPDVRVVVPGHGNTGDQSLLTHTVKILDKWNDENP